MSRERVMHSTLISTSVGKKGVPQQLFISKFGFFALRVDHCVLLLLAQRLNFISFRLQNLFKLFSEEILIP